MPADRPNVIVFMTDQQRWDSLGTHGNPLDLTPNLDRVANTGTDLVNAFTPQPVCAPARAVLQTGQYATRTGVFRNGLALPQDMPTLAGQFAAAGYDTGYIGKWHLSGSTTEPVPEKQRAGYDHWLAGDVVEFISDAYDARLYDRDDRLVRLPGYRADAYVDAAIRYISAERDRPFFLFLSLLEPHHQNDKDDYLAPTGYRERYENAWTPPDLAALGGSSHEHLAGYWGIIRRIDEAFGRLLDAVHSVGVGDGTIVAFTTDHGCHFKTRNSEYKRSPHDASIRIPLVLSGPGFAGGGRVESFTGLIDLPPTLLDAAGLPMPEAMQGRSIARLLAGRADEWPDEAFVQISESQVGRAIRTADWLYAVTAPRADPWADPSAAEYVDALLYDISADPYELTNLVTSPAHADILPELRERLIRRMVEAGESEPVIHPASRARR